MSWYKDDRRKLLSAEYRAKLLFRAIIYNRKNLVEEDVFVIECVRKVAVHL